MNDNTCRLDGCTRPIWVKKWQLCRYCYKSYQRAGKLTIPIVDDSDRVSDLEHQIEEVKKVQAQNDGYRPVAFSLPFQNHGEWTTTAPEDYVPDEIENF